jgi:hypothetical protein
MLAEDGDETMGPPAPTQTSGAAKPAEAPAAKIISGDGVAPIYAVQVTLWDAPPPFGGSFVRVPAVAVDAKAPPLKLGGNWAMWMSRDPAAGIRPFAELRVDRSSTETVAPAFGWRMLKDGDSEDLAIVDLRVLTSDDASPGPGFAQIREAVNAGALGAKHHVAYKTLAAHKRLLALEPKVGDLVDIIDTIKHWRVARVIEVDSAAKTIKVHYDGWSVEWDETLPMKSERLAPGGSKTAATLGTGDKASREPCELAPHVDDLRKTHAQLDAIRHHLIALDPRKQPASKPAPLAAVATHDAKARAAPASPDANLAAAASVPGASPDGNRPAAASVPGASPDENRPAASSVAAASADGKVAMAADGKVAVASAGSAGDGPVMGDGRFGDLGLGLGAVLPRDQLMFVLTGDNLRWVTRIMNSIIAPEDVAMFELCQTYLQCNVDIIVYALFYCKELPLGIQNLFSLIMGADAVFMRYYVEYGRAETAKCAITRPDASVMYACRPPQSAPDADGKGEIPPLLSVHWVDNVNHFGNAGGYVPHLCVAVCP